MRKIIVTGALAVAAFAFAAPQASAGPGYGHGYGKSYNSGFQHTQYGGNWGGHQRQQECYWERKRVRIWDEHHGAYVWVWRRVRVCH